MNWTIKVDRAKQHLQELQNEISVFFASNPYRIGTKRDPQTRRLTYYLTDVKDVPKTIPLISGDVIQNLRSALDQLAYELFLEETKGKYIGRHIYFPIEKDAKTYKKVSDRKTSGISKKAKRLIDSVKPYKGGNDILWYIHELNIVDKHRLLVTVGSSYGSVDVGAHMHSMMRKSFPDLDVPEFSIFLRPEDNLFPLKAGDELFGTEPDAEEDPNMKFQFKIVLNEPGIIEGAPLMETLQNMIDEVDKLIHLFK